MKKTKPMPYDVADAFRVAKWTIRENGNRLTLISAFGILILCGMLYYFLYAVLAAIAALLMVEESLGQLLLLLVYLPLAVLLTVFLLLPLFQGVLLLARGMIQKEDTDLFDIFRPFSQKKLYRRYLGLSWGAVWRIGLLALSVSGTYLTTLYFFRGSLAAGLVCALIVLLELAVGMILCTRTYFVLYLASMEERMPLRNVRKRARQLRRHMPFGALRYYAFFVPRVLLGLVTLGIYLRL